MIVVEEAPARTDRDLPTGGPSYRWLAVAVPVVAIALAVAGHAWGVPRTDDWAFARVAYALHDTGHLHLVGWSQMNLLGLVIWAQPWLILFGNHQWVLDAAAASLVGIGLAGVVSLARRATPGRAGGMAIAALVVFPGFLRDVPTFMTDAPAVAVQAVVLAVGAAALASEGRRRNRLIALVVVLGIFGFTIREFAIAAPLAVLVALVPIDRRRAVRGVIGVLVACGLFFVWRQGLAGSQTMNARPPLSIALMLMAAGACTLGLALTPVLLWTRRSWWHPLDRRIRARGQLLGALVAFIPVAVTHGTNVKPGWLLGNYLNPVGVNGSVDTLGGRPTLIPAGAWFGLSVVGIVAMVVISGLVAEALATRRLRTRDALSTMLGAHVVIAALAIAAACVLNGSSFDRYLWPIVVSGSLIILRRYPTTGRHGMARAGLGILVALTLALTLNSVSFDGARWSAGQQLVASGVPAQQIDAGFEWTGAHATAVADLTRPYRADSSGSWWTAWFPHAPICAVVAASPVTIPGYVLTGTRTWNLLLVAVPEHLSVYRSTSAGCPSR